MRFTRNLPPVQSPTSIAPKERGRPELTSQTTRRVNRAAPADAAGPHDVAPTVDQGAGTGFRSNGRWRTKLRQWFGKGNEHSPLAPEQTPLAPQFALNIKNRAPTVAFVLPEASGPTLLTQAVASALACAARAGKSSRLEGPPKYFDANLVTQLLHRDTPKMESFEQLSAAPVERALETILADEAIRHMPPHLIAPIAELGLVSAVLLDQASPERRLAWTRALCKALQHEHPRPWSVKTPITSLLCEGTGSDESKADALVTFLREAPNNGFEAMATMDILRALYLSADRNGFAAQTVPFIPRANNFYVNNMLGLTGRIYVDWGAQKPKHQSVGLTAYGAPSPVDVSWMQPGLISSHLYQPNPKCSVVVRDLAYGNPYGVGISGSTNIFLFAAGHFNTLGATHIDMMAMATSMAIMLCYNGGHSFNEVYAAAQMYPDAPSNSLAPLASYHPGHARGLFIDQVDPQNSWLAEQSFNRLAAFLINPTKSSLT